MLSRKVSCPSRGPEVRVVGRVDGALLLLQLRARHRAGALHFTEALELAARPFDVRLALRDRRLRLRENRLEWTGVDGEEQVAFFHVGAVGEMDLGDFSGDLRL